MTLNDLKVELKRIADTVADPEVAHVAADAALLRYINNPTVTRLFGDVEKYYA